MKKVITLCAAVLLAGVVTAQTLKDTDVPSAVKAAFAKNFPNAKEVKWSKESETEFEAEFKNGAVEQAANFDASGKWVVTETEIKKTDLSAAIQATLKKDFAGYKIEEAEKVEMPGKDTFYEVELEKGEKTVSVQLSADGKVLKTEEKKEEKD